MREPRFNVLRSAKAVRLARSDYTQFRENKIAHITISYGDYGPSYLLCGRNDIHGLLFSIEERDQFTICKQCWKHFQKYRDPLDRLASV